MRIDPLLDVTVKILHLSLILLRKIFAQKIATLNRFRRCDTHQIKPSLKRPLFYKI